MKLFVLFLDYNLSLVHLTEQLYFSYSITTSSFKTARILVVLISFALQCNIRLRKALLRYAL